MRPVGFGIGRVWIGSEAGLVRTAGVEPAQPRGRGILSQLSSLILFVSSRARFFAKRL